MRASQRGMALPLAVLALVVIAGLVAGAFASAFVEQRVGRNTLYAVQAAGAAEAGAAAVVGAWDGLGLSLLGTGQSAVLPTERLPGPSTYMPTVSRLNGELFLVRVEGVRTDAHGTALARREVGLLLRVADSAAAGLAPVRPLAHRAWLPMSWHQ
jgi:hypothetical protein